MQAVLSAPFGHVRITAEGGLVTSVQLGSEELSESIPEDFPPYVVTAVQAYLDGRAPRPVAPTKAEGTEFQKSVWDALADIPPGNVLTYGELAGKLGKPGAARAVGQALRNNPLPLIWPCHRVVAKDGLGGFGGASHRDDPKDQEQLGIKMGLLKHETGMVQKRAKGHDR